MGNTQTQVELGPIIGLCDIFEGKTTAIDQLQTNLMERSYTAFSLTEKEKIQTLHYLVNDINQFFKRKQDEKDQLVSEEGNVGYVKTSTREFIKLRSSDIPNCKEKIEQIRGDNATLALDYLAEIGWKCLEEMNKTVENPLPQDELKDLKECLEERASLSVIHYFPAVTSEATNYVHELPNASDKCGHTSKSFEVCSQHRDTGIFTLILTSQVHGLEVFDTKLNCWIPIEKLIQPYRDSPRKEIMVLMMGHKAPLFLGKHFEATLHRVTVEKGVERPSFLYFMDTAKIS